MMAFPAMLIGAAEQAGIAIPPDVDNFDKNQFVHFYILCQTQLCRPMDFGEHFDSAKQLAKLDAEQLKTMTVDQLEAAGVACRRS